MPKSDIKVKYLNHPAPFKQIETIKGNSNINQWDSKLLLADFVNN